MCTSSKIVSFPVSTKEQVVAIFKKWRPSVKNIKFRKCIDGYFVHDCISGNESWEGTWDTKEKEVSLWIDRRRLKALGYVRK